MKRKPFIAANWKMNKTNSEAIQSAKELALLTKELKQERDVIIAPAYVSLLSVYEAIKASDIKLSAQNVFFEKDGAYTGEVSFDMLLSVGCSYVIIGHSERRHIFNESDEMINKKVKASLNYNLNPILCIGEKKEERDLGNTFEVLDKQLKKGIDEVDFTKNVDFIVAYEPVWAIGTGDTATVLQVDEVHKFLRKILTQYKGTSFADKTRILYGGSVTPNNIKELMQIEDVDGVLVGGASLKAETFFKIINY